MAGRRKIALTYAYSENWVAGSYYVINVIRALDTLDDREKPHIFILLDAPSSVKQIEEIGYPYLSFVIVSIDNDHFFNKYIRKLFLKLTGKDVVLERRLAGVKHVWEGSNQFNFIPNHYYWVHDFQECRLPDFFTTEEAAARSALPLKVAALEDATLILSSHDALNDFKTFFPGYICKVKVLQFASSLPDFSDVDFESEANAFHIKKPYFICSNQLWQHKNHWTVLKAIQILKQEGLEYQVVFTGKNYDHRHPAYFEELKEFVRKENLEPWVLFLGFIDRKVQLCLASQSLSYIQPSLFEGWSTTVEDAKNRNLHVILSDIPVHREQLKYNVDFFNPYDPGDLADKMRAVIKHTPSTEKRNYQENIKDFGKNLSHLFS